MKTIMIATALVGALAMGSAASADTFLTLTPGSFAVENGDQTSGIGFSLGTDIANEGAFALSAEVGMFDAMNNTWTLEATAAAAVDVMDINEDLTFSVGGFAGVEMYDVAAFNLDDTGWVYGVQASFGNDDVALRTRFYLEDLDNVDARVALTLNF